MSKVLVIGIDGLDCRLIDLFIDELPNFQKLKDGSQGLKMQSIFPPDTTPAWATIYTGLNPAEHGTINFVNIADKSGSYKPLKLKDEMLKGKTFWDVASQNNKRVHVILPQNIYPGWEVNGSMVCRINKVARKNHPLSAYPESILSRYSYSAGSLNSTPGFISEKGLPRLIEDCKAKTEAEVNLGLQMLKNEKWDLFFVYISSVDGIQHYFWNYFDKTHPNYPGENRYENIIKDFYIIADKAIGRFIDCVDSDATVLVISDHGHGLRPVKLVNLNEILRQEGYLFAKAASKKRKKHYVNKKWLKSGLMGLIKTFGAGYWAMKIAGKFPAWKKILASSADFDWAKTIAYVSDLSTVKSYSYGGIRINREAIKDNYDKIVDRIIALVEKIEHPETSEKLVKWVCRRENLYEGAYLDKYPEIVLELKEDYGLGWEINGPIIGDGDIHNVQPGSHKMDTPVLFVHNLNGRNIVRKEIELMDIAPTILSLVDIDTANLYKHKSFIALD